MSGSGSIEVTNVRDDEDEKKIIQNNVTLKEILAELEQIKFYLKEIAGE